MKRARSKGHATPAGWHGPAPSQGHGRCSSGRVPWPRRLRPWNLSQESLSPLPAILAPVAFVLLSTALAVRPILGEGWTVRAMELVSPSPLWWNNSPGVMYIAHILACVGVLLGVLWMVVARRIWRTSGLELAAGILTVAMILSVPGASDKRLAINVAVGTILPLVAAAVLYQILATSTLWRRALLAALVAGAIANCYVSARQQTSEYEANYKLYMADKTKFWTSQGKSPDDPEVAIYEARLLARQPIGYFYHANVMASFLLLGLAGTVAAASAFGWCRSGRNQAVAGQANSGTRPDEGPPESWTTAGVVAAGIGLAVMVLWQFVVIRWVGSAGATAGLAMGGAAGASVWLLRRRPIVTAAVCLVVLTTLQGTLVVLSMNAGRLYPNWCQSDSKLRSLAFRLNYWQGATTLFAQQPMTGVGPGQFGKRYVAVKPIHAAEEVQQPHNWLLNAAAETGILGVIGVIVALVVPGWKILKSLARPPGPAEEDRPSSWVFLLALGTAFACYVVSLPGIVSAGSAVFLYMAEPIGFALIAAAIVSQARLQGRLGVAILFGGLVAFAVHATVEMSSSVAGAMWPFWAFVVLTLAWAGAGEEQGAVRSTRQSRWRGVLPGGVAIAAMAGLWLTCAPLSSLLAMNRARHWLTDNQPWAAVAELNAATQADPLDPAPHAALSLIYQKAAEVSAADRGRMTRYLRDSAQAADLAVQCDPQDNMLLNDQAMVHARLAAVTHQTREADAAVAAMRQAVELYPNWPRGRWKLAEILAGAGEPPNVHPDLVRDAIEQFDLTLQLDAGWPSEDPRRLRAGEIERIKARRREILGWLQTVSSRPAPARP